MCYLVFTDGQSLFIDGMERSRIVSKKNGVGNAANCRRQAMFYIEENLPMIIKFLFFNGIVDFLLGP